MKFFDWLKNLFKKKEAVVIVKEAEPERESISEPAKKRVPKNPAYEEAKKYEGKSEFDSDFNKWLSKFWALVGLPNYKTIIGSSFAWCALFVVAMQSETGMQYISKYGAAARTHAKYGVAVDYKKDGIPQGAVIHINHKSCASGSGNHVTFSDSSCKPESFMEMKKNSAGVWEFTGRVLSDATFVGLGGNQSNKVKKSVYAISKICAVRWPAEIELPSKVTENINCGSGKDNGESTK